MFTILKSCPDASGLESAGSYCYWSVVCLGALYRSSCGLLTHHMFLFLVVVAVQQF